jgi:hypothetical protein
VNYFFKSSHIFSFENFGWTEPHRCAHCVRDYYIFIVTYTLPAPTYKHNAFVINYGNISLKSVTLLTCTTCASVQTIIGHGSVRLNTFTAALKDNFIEPEMCRS